MMKEEVFKMADPSWTRRTRGRRRDPSSETSQSLQRFGELVREELEHPDARDALRQRIRRGAPTPMDLVLLRLASEVDDTEEREPIIFLSRYPLGTHDPLEEELKRAHAAEGREPASRVPPEPGDPDTLVEVTEKDIPPPRNVRSPHHG